VLIISGYWVYKTRPIELTISKPTKGNIQESVEVSGTIESERSKVYYSSISAPVSEISFTQGESVTEGQSLISFDTKDLQVTAEQTDISLRASKDNYESAVNNSQKNGTNYANATTSLGILEQQIADEKACISNIQESLVKAQEIATEITQATSYMASLTDSKELAKQQKHLEELQSDYDSYDVPALNGDLAYHQTELTQCLTSQSEYKAQQKTADAGLLNNAAKDQLKSGEDLAKISKEQAADDLVQAQKGIRADFDGIVTSVDIDEGAVALEGTRLFEIESNKELKVVVEISKYDISKIEFGQKAVVRIAGNEYKATVSKINKVATLNDTDKPQVPVEIHIENPDEKLYLGLEGDVTIDTKESKDTLLISATSVYTDDTGTYCYLIENGLITKKYFTKGVENDSFVEVLSDLTEGSVVITDPVTDESVGKRAKASE
jgi:RND family efflux transporter MFP subunit